MSFLCQEDVALCWGLLSNVAPYISFVLVGLQTQRSVTLYIQRPMIHRFIMANLIDHVVKNGDSAEVAMIPKIGYVVLTTFTNVVSTEWQSWSHFTLFLCFLDMHFRVEIWIMAHCVYFIEKKWWIDFYEFWKDFRHFDVRVSILQWKVVAWEF